MTTLQEFDHVEYLLETLPIGSTVYCINRYTSRSGGKHIISLHIIQNGTIEDISCNAAAVLGYKYCQKYQGIIVYGGGMDMGHNIVANLSYRLHGYASQNVSEDEQIFPVQATQSKYKAGNTLNYRWI